MVIRQKTFALDACGGSGNVSHKLLKRGVKVILCDISQELTNLCVAKTQANKSNLMVVNSEITKYLEQDVNYYNLIVYSPALHHLANFTEVLRLSLQRLKPGGIAYTVFDPTPRSRVSFSARILLGLDYFLFKVRYQPFDMILGSMRRVRRLLRSLFNAFGVPNRLG